MSAAGSDDHSRLRDVKKLAFTVGAAIAFFTVLNFAVVFVCQSLLQESAFRFSRIASGKLDVEILAVGNSRGVNMIGGTLDGEPHRIFNASYNGLGRASLFALVREFILHGNKAQIVLIEISGLASTDVNCEMKPYWTLLHDLEQTSVGRCADDARSARLFPPTLYNSELFIRAMYYATLHARTDQDWTNEYEMTPATCRLFTQSGNPTIRGFQPRSADNLRRDVAAFETWMAAKAPNVKVAYVLAPFLTTPAAKRDVMQLAAAANDVFGGRYLNLATALGGDCTAFADSIHLNRQGRARIRAAVLAYARSALPQAPATSHR